MVGLLLALAFLTRPGAAQAPPTETLNFLPVADVHVDASTATTSYKSDTQLKVDGSPVNVAYLRFTVAGVNGRAVQQARLRMQVTGDSVVGGTIHKITNNTWDANTIVYNTRPTVDGPGLQTLGAVSIGQTVEWNLDGTITGDGTYSLAIDSTNGDSAYYASSRATSGLKPTLVLTVAASSAPTVTIVQPSNNARFITGDPVTLQATATDTVDGNLSAQISWSSNKDGALGTGATLTRTLSQNSHVLTASVTDHDHFTGSAQVNVVVAPPGAANTEPLVSITSPINGQTITTGTAVALTATANDQEDGNLTSRIAWTSDLDGNLGTGGSASAANLRQGVHHITAAATDNGGLRGATMVTVSVVPPTTVEFAPIADAYVDSGFPTQNFGTDPALIIDATAVRISYLRFQVSGVGGRSVTRALLRLKVDSASASDADNGGTVQKITNNAWVETGVNYNTRPALDGTALASSPAVKLGQVVDFDVTSAVTGDRTYNFAVTSPSADAAKYIAREGATPPKLILVLSGNAPAVTISAPANGAVAHAGDAVTLTASATDSEDGNLSNNLRWSSDLDNVLGTGASLSVNTLRIGTHTITAAVTDSANMAGQAQVTLRVRGTNSAPTLTITSPAHGASTPVGTPVTLSATVADDFDANLGGQVHWSSSLDGSLGTFASRALTLSEGTHTLTASVTDSDGAPASAQTTITITPTPPTVAITAPTAGLIAPPGYAITFSGTATDAVDGSLSSSLHWTSSRDGAIGDGASFSVSSLSVGTHTITAAATNSRHVTGQVQRTIEIRNGNAPPQIAITSPSTGDGLLAGQPALLSATATDFEDGNLSAAIRWTSSRSGALGTGASITVTSLAVGTHTLTATVTDQGGTSASATVNVTVSASSLTFTPVADTYVISTSPTSKFGTATSFQADTSPICQAFLRFQVAGLGAFTVDKATLRLTVGSSSSDGANHAGTIQALSNDTWTEAATTYNTRPTIDGSVLAVRAVTVKASAVVDFDVTAAVTHEGSLNLALVGNSTDNVLYKSREASSGKPQLIVTLKRNTPPTVTITAPLDGAQLTPATAVTLTGTATDAESGNLSSQIAWSSSRDGALGVGASVRVTSLTPGTHTLTARITDPSGASAQAHITVNVGRPPVVAISAPTNNQIIFTNDLPLALSAAANDPEDGNVSASIHWSSSRDGMLGNGGNISTSALSIGTHTLSAVATDSSNLTGQAQVMVRVRGPNAAPIVAISAPSSGASAVVGTAVTFTGTASDDFDGDISSRIQWASSLDGSMGQGASISTGALRIGTHTITATVTDSDNVTRSKDLTFIVTPAPPAVTIMAPAVGTRVNVGTAVALSGSAMDTTDGDISGSMRWMSDRDGLLGTGPSFSRNDLSIGTHMLTAEATSSRSLTGTAQRTLVVRAANTPPSIAIDAPLDQSALLAGKPIMFAAEATDVDDGDLAASIRWSSSRDGALGTGSPLVVPSLTAGVHTITASVTDRDGETVTTTVSVTLSPSTLTFTAIADTYVDGSATSTKFGTATTLFADASPIKEALLRFQLSGIGSFRIDTAKLRMTAASTTAAPSNAAGIVHMLNDNTWSEAGTSYSNKPQADAGPALASGGAVAANQVIDFDVKSALFGDGTYNFSLLTTSADEVVYQSREATAGKPQLIVGLTQNQPPSVTITAPANGFRVNPGVHVAFTASAIDAENGNLSARVEWSSSLDGNLGTGASITVPTLSDGTHFITARAVDNDGGVGQAEIVVNVGHRPVVRITSPANNAIIFDDDLPAQLTATATDFEDGDLRSGLTWTSSINGALGNGPIVLATLSRGTHTLTASVTDSSGLRVDSAVTVRVRGPNEQPDVRINAPADGTVIRGGTAITLTGTALDDFDGSLTSQIHWTSSRDGDLGTGASRTVTLREGQHVLTASVVDSDGAMGSAHVNVEVTAAPPVVGITSPAVGTRVFTGTTLTFTGSALDAQDGNLSAGLRWTSDRDGLIGTGGSFSTAALTIGTHSITAAVADSGNLVGAAARTVVVRALNQSPVLVIEAPSNGTQRLSGKPIVLAATAQDVEDGNLGAAIRWTSSIDGNLGTGTVLTIPSLSPGTHTITASVTDLDGAAVSKTVSVTVSQAMLTILPVADTYVDSGATSTKFGTATSMIIDNSPVKIGYLRFTVSGIGSLTVESVKLRMTAGSASASSSNLGGEIHRVSDNTWSEANTTYANRPSHDATVIASAGTVAANALIDFDLTSAITADGTYNFALVTTSSDDVIYQSREASAGKPQLIVSLKQNTAPVVRITAPAAGTIANIGAAVTFQAVATDAESGSLSSNVQWSSSLDGAFGSGAARTISTLRAGVHTITARVTDAQGLSGQAQMTLQVGRTPTVAIVAPAHNSVFYLRERPITLTATANDFEDGDIARNIRWSSSRDNALGTGASIPAASLSLGTHVLTATVTDSDGQQGQASVTIRMRAENVAPTLTIAAPANGTAVPAGTRIVLTATAVDDFDGDISSRISWRSNRDGTLGTGASRDVLLTEGGHTITATITDSDGAVSTASISVAITATAPVVTIASPVANATPLVNTSITFTASAMDATDGDLSGTLHWTSSRDGAIGNGPTFSVSNLTMGAHVITAAVTDSGGLVGSAQVGITVIRMPAVTILLPQQNDGYLAGADVTFFGVAEDLLDGDVSANLVWTDSVAGQIGTGQTFTVTNLTQGAHTVTARAVNSDSRAGTAQVTFNVNLGSISFTPVQDLFVDASTPTVKYGTDPTLSADSSPVKQSFLRFDVTGIGSFRVREARLELTVVSNATAASVFGGSLHTITNNTWSEATTTYNSRPALDGTLLAVVDTAVAPAEIVPFNVSEVVRGDGSYNFAFTSSNVDQVIYNSREATAGRPRLVIDLDPPATQQPPQVTITSPATGGHFFNDAPVTFTATATDAEDGNLANQITWTSSITGALGTGATVARILPPGSHTITASVRDSFGLRSRTSILAVVGDRPPTVTITAPEDGTLFPVGFAVSFTATATDPTEGDLAAGITWTSDRDGVIGMGRSVITSTLTPGDHHITASVRNAENTLGSAMATVFIGSAPPQVAITAPADGNTVLEGTPVTLTGTARDLEDGDIASHLTWTSDRQGTLGTGASLPVTLTTVGVHRIRASVTDSHGFTRFAEIGITVNKAAPVVTITAPQAGASFSGPVAFTATASDYRDGDVTSSIRWSSSIGGSLGVGGNVTAPALGSGLHVITAQVTDRDGLIGSATISIAVGNTAPVVQIQEPISGSAMGFGQQVRFRGTATDSGDGSLTANIKWFSNLNGQIGTGATFTTTSLLRGTHMISAVATDSKGVSGITYVYVKVTAGGVGNAPPVVNITGPAAGTTVAPGATLTFTASALDDVDGDRSNGLTWVSDVDGYLGTGPSLSTTTLSVGNHVVTAAAADSGGLYGSATVTVTVGAPPISLEPVADAWTDASLPNDLFGTATTLQADATPARKIFLRFNVTGFSGAVSRAVVRLTASGATSAGSDVGGTIHKITNNTWSEATLNFSNEPMIDGPGISTVGMVMPAQVVEFDVTSAITGNGTYNFAIDTTSGDVVQYRSREGAVGHPLLVIERTSTNNSRPVVNISAPADFASVLPSTALTFTATATDPQDGDVSASLVWRSDRDGLLGNGASISRALTAGAHTITATATDSNSNSTADAIHVTVRNATGALSATIDAPVNNATVGADKPVVFAGSAFSPRDGDISADLNWTSSIDGVIGHGASFKKLLTPGTHTITATVTDSATNTATATATVISSAVNVGYRDSIYGAGVAVGGIEATSQKPESKLWTHDGIWWGTLFSPSARVHRIHRLDLPTQKWIDTGVLIDERPYARQDILSEGDKLYVVNRFGYAGSNASGLPHPPLPGAQCRFSRYTYYPQAQTYALDPGFPVNIPGHNTEAMGLAKDSTGRLWIAFTLDSQVWVAHTLADDLHWSEPFVIPVNPAVTSVKFDDIAGILSLPGKIGVFWSNQNDTGSYFAVHNDGTSPTDPASWSLEVVGIGSSFTDDHMNFKVASDGRVFAAVKTSRTALTSILVGLVVRGASGGWSQLYPVGLVPENPTRPICQLDETAKKVYVFYALNHEAIYYKSSDTNNISFPTGPGTPFITSSTVLDVNDPTGSKQEVDASTGIVVEASSNSNNAYWHNTIDPLPRPSVTLSAPLDATKFKAGAAVGFSATAESAVDGNLTTSIKWISSRDGEIGTGGSFSKSNLSVGTHLITAQVTDSNLIRGMKTVAITVETDVPPVVTIDAPVGGTKFLAGRPITFTGSALDSLDGDRSAALVWTSSLDGQIGTGATFTRSNLSVGTHTITASAADLTPLTGTRAISITVANASTPSLTLTSPTDGKLFAFGTPVVFNAAASEPFDGNLTPQIQWTSSRDGNLGMGGTFRRSNLSQGNHVITARVTDSAGLSASASVNVNVQVDAPPVVTMTSPAAGLYVFGKSITFSATATDAIDGNVSSTLTWNSSRDGQIGTGTSFSTTTLSAGIHTITASAQDRSGLVGIAQVQVEVRVQSAPVIHITSPADATEVLFGETVSFAATATDNIDGNLGSSIRWTSSRTGFLGTGATLNTSLGLGLHTITASATNSGTQTGTASITVRVESGPQISILAPADMTLVSFGDLVTFTGNALDFEDGDLTSGLSWRSSRDGLLGTGPTVTANLTLGVHTITATATDTHGHIGRATIAVNVNAKPTVAITAPATGAFFTPGQPVTFTSSGTDAEDGNVAASTQWTSSLDGVLGTGASLTVSTLRTGSHTITARVTDRDGQSRQAQITIGVSQPPTITILAPATGTTHTAGTAIAFSANANDAEDGNISSTIAWSSDRNGPLGTGGTLPVSTLVAGTHVITASVRDSAGRTADASIAITINIGPSISITGPANLSVYSPGDTVVFSGSAADTEDGDLTARIMWDSDRDGHLGDGGSISVPTLTSGTHVVTAAIVDNGGARTTALVTVVVNAAPTVAITAPTGTLLFSHGAAITFTGAAQDLEDGNRSSAITWSSNLDGSLGSGATLSVSSLRSGLHVITAHVADTQGKTADATLGIEVNSAPTVSISAPANNAGFTPGATITFAASANDFEQGDLSSSIDWSSSVEGPIGHGASINVSSLRSGTHLVTALVSDARGRQGSAQVTVTVNDGPTITITSPANGTVFSPTDTVAFAATATDTEDGNLAARVAWVSNIDGPLNTGGSFSRTLTSGDHTITATVTDNGGKTATTAITLHVNAAPTVAISAPANNAVFSPTDSITFTGAASDLEQGNALTASLAWTSDLDGPIGTGGSFTTTLRSGTHTITASVQDAGSKSGSASITVRVNAAPTVHITAPANNTVYSPGNFITFSANATDAETPGLTATIHWVANGTTDLGTGGSVSTSALASGTHTITATVTDAGGKSATDTVTISVNAAPTISITAPANNSVYALGQDFNLTGTASDLEDHSLNTAIQWTSSLNGPLGTGASITAHGLNTGVHTITASVTDAGGKTASASISVVVNQLPSLTISAPTTSGPFAPGSPITFTASAFDPEDLDITSTIVWTEGVLPRGLGGSITLSNLSSGSHTLTATAHDTYNTLAVGSITVIVDAAPTLAITGPASGSKFVPDAAIVFTATASDTEDGNLATSVHWSSTLDGPLGTGGSLSIDTLSSGTHTITATVEDSRHQSASKNITVRVNALPMLAISTPADGAVYAPGASVAFEADATDLEDETLTVHWTSSIAGNLGTGASLTVSNLAVGVHTITASTTDSGNETAQATITVIVNEHPAVSISSPVSSGPYAPGAAIGFVATAGDPEDGSLTNAIAWTDEFDNALGTGGAINVSSLTSGIHLITATVQDSRGVIATDQVTVIIDALPTLAIAGPTSGGKYVPGAEVALEATASDLEDGPLGTAIHWSSNLDGPLGTGANLPVTTLSSGTHTITATVEDSRHQTASDLITVIVNAHPTLDITAPSDNAMFAPGADVTLEATASDVEDASLTIHWTSSIDGNLGTGASLTVSSLTTGVHTITASVTDSGSEIAEDTVTVVINANPTVMISGPLDPGTVGTPIALSGTANDDEDGDLADTIAWHSDLDGDIGVGASVSFTPATAGDHVITATVRDSRDVEATATITLHVE